MKVLITDPLHPEGLAYLQSRGVAVLDRSGEGPEVWMEELPGVDGWIVRGSTRVKEEHLRHASRLKVIVRAGIGLDNIDLEAASRHGVLVMNTPEATAGSVAEHALALMLAVARRVVEGTESLRAGRWIKKQLVGMELAGKRLGILGYGRIGAELARRALAMGMEVVGYRRTPQRLPYGQWVSLEELLSTSDVISIHLPGGPQTRHFVNAERIRSMKPGVVLVNTARGSVLDAEALYAALEEGQVAGAGLDVLDPEPPPPDHPLLQHPRVVLTPHIAAQTTEAQRRAALQAAEKLLQALQDSGDVLG